MRLAVCVKHAVDETELKIDSSGRPILTGAASKMSTFDKNAVEEALRLRTAQGGEVVVLTVGTQEARKSMKEALAMGADSGMHIVADGETLDPMLVAQALAMGVQKGGPFDLVLCSEGSSDTYCGQVPSMLAEILGYSYVGYSRRIELTGKTARLERALEDSVEVIDCQTPLVVSVVSEINEPRYPTLIQIMQASKKPVTETSPEQLGVGDKAPLVRVASMIAQPMVRKRVLIEGTPEESASKLMDALTKEGVVKK